MQLKDLEKITLIETALMLGVPSIMAMLAFDMNPENFKNLVQALNTQESRGHIMNQMPNNYDLYILLAAIPRITEMYINARLEINTEDYKQIKKLYNNIITNLANFLKEQNITDPVEIFVIYQFMYRKGYLSYNHNFNYDADMKDLANLHGADLVRGTGVCRSISSFLTDLYKAMGYNACNLLVNANRTVLDNIDRQGNYPRFTINKKTSKFVKLITNLTTVIPMPNHLITLLEKDGKTYIFDPTNDAFLIKGKNNELILPEQKEGKMKISYIISALTRVQGTMGNLQSKSEVENYLQNSTIDYETYKEIYKNTLIYVMNNFLLFEQFYENNSSLYLELFQTINNQSELLERIFPELKYLKKIAAPIKHNRDPGRKTK